MITTGLEEILNSPPRWLAGKRLGLLCNQASTDSRFRHAKDLIAKAFPGQLQCLFSPQHGFYSEKQDNMIESDHAVDADLKIPVFSLYGETRRPQAHMLDGIDILLVDLFDVGTRVYTFVWTLYHCLDAASRAGRKVVVLDRPNPVGGDLAEGNLLESEMTSFVGMHPIPMRHGLTIGELALYLNAEAGIGADLAVIAMQGWRRQMLFTDTGLPWVFPSPNMPTPATALVYPGQVIWEGTNISEGRGTTMPFELFGAPFIDCDEILSLLPVQALPGCVLRQLLFQPTSGKWSGQNCHGFQLHVTSPALFRPYRTALIFLQLFQRLYPQSFAYKAPPYEYEFERQPIDLIIGSSAIRQALEAGTDILQLEAGWQGELDRFDRRRREYFLYS